MSVPRNGWVRSSQQSQTEQDGKMGHTWNGRSKGLKKFVSGTGVTAVLMLQSADSLLKRSKLSAQPDTSSCPSISASYT